MTILPKRFLRIFDVADYLNSVNSNLKYELQDSSERYRLYNDIYDLVTQDQLVAVFKNFTDDFKDAYFVVPDWKLQSILQEDDLIPMNGKYSIYCYDKGEKLTESESASISHNLAISFDDIYIPRAELDKLFKVDSEKDNEINKLKARNIDLETELAQVKAQLKEQTDKPANAGIDEGQGDTLLILGAVMDCIKEVAKPNYTQQSLINAITDKYKNTSSLTDSTLTKKFPKAKTYLKQNVTS